MKKVDHIGIAVKSLAVSGSIYERILGIKSYKNEYVATEQVNTLFFKTGENKIELLESSADDGPIAKFLERKGEGIHHIAFAVDDIVAEMKRLKAEGFVLLNDEPKPGADNKLVCFIHPKGTSGVLVELCQDNNVTPPSAGFQQF